MTIVLPPISVFAHFETHFMTLLGIIILIYMSLGLSLFVQAVFNMISSDPSSCSLIPASTTSKSLHWGFNAIEQKQFIVIFITQFQYF